MNYKLLFFAGAVTAVVGFVLGIILAALLPTPYTGGLYQEQKSGYKIAGALGGFIIGISQEAVRQLKQKQDQD